MEWNRRVAQTLGAVVVGVIASNLVTATTSLANEAVPADIENLHQSWQLVSYDQTPEGDLLYTAQIDEETSDYQQWLAASVMPLLDQDNPERLVSREEFVFVLEEIAARYGQAVSEELALARNYCDIHGNAAGYLEGRISSLSLESDQLISAARSITNHSEHSSSLRFPLRPLWEREQSEKKQSEIKQHKGTQDQNKQQFDAQLSGSQTGQPSVQMDSTQAEERPNTPSPNIFSPPNDWPSDILYRPGELAYSVQLVYALFGDVSFEDGTFRPAQAVTQGALIDYFNRPETTFVRNLNFVDIDWVRQNYISSEGADKQLSAVLNDVAEMRSLIHDLREAISSSKENPYRDKSYDKAVQQIPNSLISQSPSVPPITSITEIPDVSPSDSVYAPLQVLVEDWGIDIIQSDGHFNGETALTRGEFARYLDPVFSSGNGFNSYLISETCARAGDHYAYLQTEVQNTRSALQQALDAINP